MELSFMDVFAQGNFLSNEKYFQRNKCLLVLWILLSLITMGIQTLMVLIMFNQIDKPLRWFIGLQETRDESFEKLCQVDH